jgi:signal transduction histidine kinase
VRGPLTWLGRWSLASRVILAAAVLLVVLLAIVVATQGRANSERRRAEVDHAYDMAQAVAGIVEGFTKDLETSMLTAALLLGERPGPLDQTAAGPHLKALLTQYGMLRALFITDLAGRVVASDTGTGHGVDLAARPYMQTLMGGATEVWAPGVIGLESAEVTATYGRVVTDSTGALRGYLVAAFYPPQLVNRVGGISLDADVVLLDQRGFVLHSTRHPRLPAAQRDLSGLPAVQAALGGDPVRLDDVVGLLDSEARFGAIVPIRSSGWALAFSRPVAPLETLLRERLMSQALQVSVAVLLVGVLLTVATSQIARPLARLAGIAEGVARGERQPPEVLEGGLEVRQLATAMQMMSAAVAQREDAIRQESDRRRKLADASRAFTEAVVDLDAETEAIALRVAEAVGDGCAVLLLSEQRALAIAAIYHADPERVRLARAALEMRPLRIEGGFLEPLFQSAEPIFLPDALPALREALPERAEAIERLALHSLACVSLRAHGRVIGVLGIWRDSGEGYSPEDVALLQEIGDRAALAIENARLFMEAGAHAAEAERAMAAQDDLFSLISHDLRNPMTTIKTAAQLVHRRVQSGSVRQEELLPVIELIDGAVAKATREIDTILDLSQARAGRALSLQLDDVDLIQLLRRAIGPYGEIGAGHVIELECSERSLYGRWDAARLERAFDNLISNAVKYSPQGGTITIAVRAGDSGGRPWVTVDVRDQGMGIPESELGRVFDRFYRGSQVIGRLPGTGLGLSGVKLIVEAHGGTVAVESVEGAGSTFTVRLPRGSRA